ncbi:unnamed protein product [Rhizoctonia solani]|uniref:FAD-binding PCMH-type domain-containing protein n=1 Tax=Rhizoctonia solani TaxID=456999 RepID=A0A8H3DEK7_9AGAM|nr:unnamed protein product [Rhizoctonia solani]
MILDTIAQTPALITPFDIEFHQRHANPKTIPKHGHETAQTHRDRCPVPAPACVSSVTPEQVKELRALLSPGSVLTPEDGDAYKDAVRIGNLLYIMKRPGLVVMTDIPEEIGETIKFAQKHNIEFTVKNGGHSYAGYSLNCGGILISMKGFGPNGIKVDLQSTPKTVTIPAGCVWEDVHNHFRDHGYNEMVIGGRCTSVGVSGFTLGGGVSPFSRRYGLGIDNILKAKIVTAAGECVEVSREDADPKKKELFWALRGGGGGNFGILTEFTVQIHDLAQKDGTVAYGLLTWELPSQQAQFEAMMKVYNSTQWPKELALDVIWQYKGSEKPGEAHNLVAQVLVIYDGTLSECLKVIESLTRFAFNVHIDTMKWWDVVVIEQGHEPKCPTYYSHYASMVFGQGAMTEEVVSDITKLMHKARHILDGHNSLGKPHLLWVHIGEETAKIAAEDTAFIWRDGVYVCYFKMQWTRGDIACEMIEFVDEVKKVLARHTIQGKAAYVNFMDSTIKNWQEAYYGDNYPRLQQIKKEWDPNNFFKFEQSIELPGVKGSQAVIGENLGSAAKQEGTNWGQYSLPDPDKIWNMEEPSEEKVLRAIQEQIAP